MHIAIYSYKVADRKQMERLMDRESDKWIKEGKPIYTYSFGSVESLLASTLTYDAVMVDMCDTDTVTANGLIERYRAENSVTRIIECADDMTIDAYLDENFFLAKPITVANLHDTMVKLSEKLKSNKVKIEIHAEGGTLYVDEEDFIYAVQRGSKTEVHLTGDKCIVIFGTPESFYYGMEASYPTIALPSRLAIVNIRYIDKLFFHTVTMCDGTKIKISGNTAPYIREVKALLEDGSPEAMERLKHVGE